MELIKKDRGSLRAKATTLWRVSLLKVLERALGAASLLG